MKKKIKLIIIIFFVFFVGISIGVISTNIYLNNKEPNLIKENKNWLKECKEMGYNHYIYDLVGIDM